MRYQIEFFLDTTSMYKLDFIVKFAMNGTRMKCIYPSNGSSFLFQLALYIHFIVFALLFSLTLKAGMPLVTSNPRITPIAKPVSLW